MIVHCSSFHEPVVNKQTCSYCKSNMKTKFDETTTRGHDFSSCDLCTLVKGKT